MEGDESGDCVLVVSPVETRRLSIARTLREMTGYEVRTASPEMITHQIPTVNPVCVAVDTTPNDHTATEPVLVEQSSIPLVTFSVAGVSGEHSSNRAVTSNMPIDTATDGGDATESTSGTNTADGGTKHNDREGENELVENEDNAGSLGADEGVAREENLEEAVATMVDRIEAAVRDKNETRIDDYGAVLDAASPVISVVDDTGNISYVNRAISDLLGYEPETILDQSLFNLVHTDDKAAVGEQFATYVNGSQPSFTAEVRFEHADGEWRYVEITSRQNVHPEGLDGIVVCLRGLTERKQREQELAEYETIIETAPVGLFTLDRDGVITWANDVYADTLDIPRSDLIGLSFLDLVDRGYYDDAVVEGYLDHVRTLLSDDSDADLVQYQVETSLPTGETLIHEAYLTPLPLKNEEFQGTIIAFRDVTTQREYERELERRNERLDAFTSMVSHDLRNPLSVARGHLDLAQEDGTPETFDAVNDALNRMESLIDHLLSRARAGEQIDEMSPVDLEEVAEAAWLAVDTTNADLVIDTARADSSDAVTIQADPVRLQQLLENLFRNAVDHGDTGGTALTVTVGPLESSRGVYVADDGCGIPSEDRGRIFEHGYSTDPDGTGFGLDIVSTIVDAHDWTISVTDSAEDGARFDIQTGR